MASDIIMLVVEVVESRPEKFADENDERILFAVTDKCNLFGRTLLGWRFRKDGKHDFASIYENKPTHTRIGRCIEPVELWLPYGGFW
ncbi:hypothetical protein C491_15002 [Natronococcus amylolyticus DSM 10524]|uniref:Uncharacterized protein n=1 Tax=Natronococcus amylolyticus DSM 10524 TaxID=1227497 RepID=L9X472_9EURY|nr:hypothetical protein C491_15002 [Natronococcus amylolyticus DSM 10524]